MTAFREPSSALVLHPLNDLDPRGNLDEGMLIEASRNAYPVVAANRPRRDSLGVMVGSAIALMLGLVTFYTMSNHRSPVQSSERPIAPRTTALPPVVGTYPPLAVAPTASGTLVMPHTQPWDRTQSIVTSRAADPARAPMIVFDSGGSPVPNPSTGMPNTAGISPAVDLAGAAEASVGGKSASGADDGFISSGGRGGGPVATAHALSNPGSTVTQGTLIGAVLETSINTDVPGYVRALVSRDVRSFDGSHILIPRSSRVIGEYKSGLAQGQTRAYVIWSRLIRPDGVSVTLDSPGVDFSGDAGLPGKVNSHFMKRFGSALLLSVVGGLSAIGTGGASVIATGGGQSAASVAAGRDGGISPTIRISQGEPIRIFTARDLDFSSVAPIEASQ